MTGFDLTESIAPRSDQLNAEDLLTGPRTFTITDVRKGSVEQPVDIVLAEFPGRPFKPSKTVRRILVSAWGADASAYAGRRMTLYRDEKVRFGGMDVGGIRVSHLSHITKPMTLVLAVSKGKRAPYVVKPLADAPVPASATGQAADGISDEQSKKLHALLRAAGISNRDTGLALISQTIGRDIETTKELTKAEASKAIDAIEADVQKDEPAPPEETDGWPATATIPGVES